MSAHAASIPAGETTRIPEGARWRSYPLIFGAVGILSLLAAYFLARAQDAEGFWFSYLVAFMFGLSIAIGGLFFVIVQFLAKAGWSVVVRRIAENVMGTFPLFAVLFILVVLGLPYTHQQWWHIKAGTDALVEAKAAYLNSGFFFVRAAVYFAVWCGLALTFRGRSIAQDTSRDQEITYRQQWLAPPALFLFAVTVTFSAIDWMMSMEPHWFSTMWGVYFFAGCVVANFATLTLLARWLQANGFLTHVITVEHYHDLGKLLFGFIVFWSYITFSQYFLIWYANMPEETIWFAQRARGAWSTVGRMLIFGHFLIPFILLLPRGVKRNGLALPLAAVWMLVLHYIDLYFVIMPVHAVAGPRPGPVDLLCLVGVLALQLAVFSRLMASAELLPVGDPRLAESVAFENV